MMITPLVGILVVLFVIWVVARKTMRRGPRRRRRGGSIGPGAAGAIYDLLNEDKRKAIEIIVEQKAEATDPETADDVPGPERR